VYHFYCLAPRQCLHAHQFCCPRGSCLFRSYHTRHPREHHPRRPTQRRLQLIMSQRSLIASKWSHGSPTQQRGQRPHQKVGSVVKLHMAHLHACTNICPHSMSIRMQGHSPCALTMSVLNFSVPLPQFPWVPGGASDSTLQQDQV
jgi:hypothetical protein